jgi:hypothetical protein
MPGVKTVKANAPANRAIEDGGFGVARVGSTSREAELPIALSSLRTYAPYRIADVIGN